MTLHELATNAAKYGALSVSQGHLQAEWSRAGDGRLVLRWTESGGPPVKTPTRQGFGTVVVDQRNEAARLTVTAAGEKTWH